MTVNEIKKALEKRIKDLPCIHEKYEPACGMWCEHLHMWCTDFNNKSLKEKCSEYKPCCSMTLEKQVLDLFARQEAEVENLEKMVQELIAENENLNDILYDAEGVNLVNYWHQQCKIVENGNRNFDEENKRLKAEIERLNKVVETELDKLKAEKNDVMYHKAQIKAEAYKECIEAVRSEIDNKDGHIEEDYALRGSWDKKYFYDSEIEDILDNLLKELERKENITYDD